MASFKGVESTSGEIASLQETKTNKNNAHHPAKTPAKKDDVKTSKYESFCKIAAVIIVVVAFVSHLLRGAQEGRVENGAISISWKRLHSQKFRRCGYLHLKY